MPLRLHPRSTPADKVYSSGLAGMPDPACSTSMGEGQAAATDDQPSITVSRAQRPYFMTEYAAGSGEYLKAFVVDENPADVRLRFPGESITGCFLARTCCLVGVSICLAPCVPRPVYLQRVKRPRTRMRWCGYQGAAPGYGGGPTPKMPGPR